MVTLAIPHAAERLDTSPQTGLAFLVSSEEFLGAIWRPFSS
jgi:hypothetical protein